MTGLPGRLVLIGHPVAHSLSPAFQNAALRRAGLPLEYAAVDVLPDDLPRVFRELAAQGAAGNVTVPHKEAVARLCDVLTPVARRAGAVNTFWRDGAEVVGDNTDVAGFDSVARDVLGREPSGVRVALLGAGGSAAAVLTAVEGWPHARAAVWSRTRSRSDALASRFDSVARSVEFLAEAIRDADLVVNATPVGLASDAIPVPPALLRARAAVVDLVYRREGPTPWVRLARARGLRAIDGLPMLIAQGALTFERWFGRVPDRDAMWAAVGGSRSRGPSAGE